ncbi:hypothetical protein MY04_2469 [Flammeovirga sp. MY04]|uniref:hypothetical protein n=1 Tax=Flammeovirga sp. MY04 TaxID=1191459 RepID=UPI000824593A|nr:hypothetical protein [Flammeovirga sp. MY04]ANQ49841.2 hypothetical protein MY04_2469 [Flammeovirga sp. MY04]
MKRTYIKIFILGLMTMFWSCSKKSNVQPTSIPSIKISTPNEVSIGEGKANEDIQVNFKAEGLIDHVLVTFPMQGLGVSVELTRVPESEEMKEIQDSLLDGELPEKIKGATNAKAFLKKEVINELKRGEQLFTFEMIDRNGNHVWQDLTINVY